MKWIGQHIWDFISRFRSDVYLEATETGTIASGGNLGLDSNNKIVKADTESGELSFDGSTVDGALTYKDADEIKVSSKVKILETGSTASTFKSYGGNLYVEGSDTDGNNGKTLALEGGDVLNNPTDKYGGSVSIKPGVSTGNTSSANVSIYTNTPGSSSNGTNQTQRQTFLFYGNRKTQSGSSRNFKTFLIDNVINGREATIEMREDTGDLFIRTWPNIYNTSGYPAGKILIEPGKHLSNAPIGEAIFNSSGKFKFQNQPYAPYGSDKGCFIQTGSSTGETTIGTEGPAGGATSADLTFDIDGDIVLDSATGIIKTGSTTFVNNSGVIQVATQGTIDHDSLANFVANEHIDWTGASAGTIHATNYSNDNDDVSVANLKTRLGSGFASNAVSIGDADDTVTIPGNLTVSGTTTTINTTDLNVEDKNITLNYHATNDTSASADGAGITVQDAVNATTDATINWNATDDTWDFSHKAIIPDHTRVAGRLKLGSSSLHTTIAHTTLGSSKFIELPNIGGVAQVSDLINSGYTQGGGDLFPQAGHYTQVTNMDMATVYALNSTPVDIVPDAKVHSSQTMMLTDFWIYVTTPNYPASGVANTSNWAFQIGKTAAAGTYNKPKGFEGLINRLGYGQPANRTCVYRGFFPNASSNYRNAEPGLGLKVWTSADPTGSASVGSESIMSIRLVVQYTIIPS